MKVTESTVHKLAITGVERFNTISVLVEEFAHGQAKVVIEHSCEAYAAYWGSMGGTVAEFFARCDLHYLAGRFAGNMEHDICDAEAIEQEGRKRILKLRRDGTIKKYAARRLWDEVATYSNFEELFRWSDAEEVFGPEWFLRPPTRTNPRYAHVVALVTVVRQALKLAASCRIIDSPTDAELYRVIRYAYRKGVDDEQNKNRRGRPDDAVAGMRILARIKDEWAKEQEANHGNEARA